MKRATMIVGMVWVMSVWMVGPGAGAAWAQSAVSIGSGMSVVQHRTKHYGNDAATLGAIGQPVSLALYLGSRVGVQLQAEFMRPYLAWAGGEYLESGAAFPAQAVSFGIGGRHNFSDSRFLLGGIGLGYSGIQMYHDDVLRSATSTWGPRLNAALYFRTRHNLYAMAGAHAAYHPESGPGQHRDYQGGYSAGINVGVAAAAPVRRNYRHLRE